MKLIINVDDSFYRSCKRCPKLHGGKFEFIANGTPLEEALVAELLDLRSEIEIYEAPIYDNTYCKGLKKTMEFIDNRISELKGEKE